MPRMSEDWRAAFKRILNDPKRGLNMKSVSLKAGLNAGALYDILERGRDPSIDNFVVLCNAAGLSPGRVLDEKFGLQIPVVGAVVGPDQWAPSAPTQSVKFEAGDHDVIALDVRGNSMFPVYRDADVIICHRRPARSAHNWIGLDCAVQTDDGATYVKILKGGTKAGTFTLKSYNPLMDDIENVHLEWAARVAWVRRGGE